MTSTIENTHFGFVALQRSYWHAASICLLSTYPWLAPSIDEAPESPTNHSGWRRLPQELRELIMEHAFSISNKEARRYITLSQLKHPVKTSLLGNAHSPGGYLPAGAVVLKFPFELIQLFVSKQFLRDALPHFAKSTTLLLNSCSIDDVVGWLPYPSRNLSQYILRKLLSAATNLNIWPRLDGIITEYGRQLLFPFKNLRQVAIGLPEPTPTWVHRPTSPSNRGGDLIPEEKVTEWSTRVQMTKRDVKNLVDHLAWPEDRDRRFQQYLQNQRTYASALSLAGALALSGHQARVSLYATFRCEQSDGADDDGERWSRPYGMEGEYFVVLRLRFDMCGDGKLRSATAHPDYRRRAAIQT